ncbi:MAG TPA: hypothetical protein VIF62_16605, partial [Labilithrix sp.]
MDVGGFGWHAWRAWTAALLAVATTTCGGDGSDSHPPNGEPASRADRLKCKFHAGDLPSMTVGATIDDFGTTPDHVPIQYVFVLMMENRSFDNYFGAFRDYLLTVPAGTGSRIAPTTPVRLDVPDPRTAPFDPLTATGGVDVPPEAYDRRSPNDQDAQDAILIPKPGQDVAPFNPTVAGIPPSARCDKHYWHHANDVLDG